MQEAIHMQGSYINVRSLINKLPELFLCQSRTRSTEMVEERNAVVVKILAVVSDRA